MENNTSNTPLIYARISACLAEVGVVGPDHRNQQQNYSFRSINDFYDRFQPVLAKHKVFIAPTILEHTREERTTKSGSVMMTTITKVRFRIYTEDGSFIEADALGEGADSGDKSANKAAASAMKYLFMQVFSVRVTGENLDTERESPQYTPRQAPQAPSASPKPYVVDNTRTYQPKPPAPAQAPKPAVAADLLPKQATEKTREWMLEQLRQQFMDAELFSYATKQNLILETEDLKDWPLSKVPTDRVALMELIREISRAREVQQPVQAPTEPPAEDDGGMPAHLRDVIIPIPHKGQKRADYLANNPDTIFSLYSKMKAGDQEAQKRLFGVAHSFSPEPWMGNDGVTRQPSADQLRVREQLDEFLEWVKNR